MARSSATEKESQDLQSLDSVGRHCVSDRAHRLLARSCFSMLSLSWACWRRMLHCTPEKHASHLHRPLSGTLRNKIGWYLLMPLFAQVLLGLLSVGTLVKLLPVPVMSALGTILTGLPGMKDKDPYPSSFLPSSPPFLQSSVACD